MAQQQATHHALMATIAQRQLEYLEALPSRSPASQALTRHLLPPVSDMDRKASLNVQHALPVRSVQLQQLLAPRLTAKEVSFVQLVQDTNLRTRAQGGLTPRARPTLVLRQIV